MPATINACYRSRVTNYCREVWIPQTNIDPTPPCLTSNFSTRSRNERYNKQRYAEKDSAPKKHCVVVINVTRKTDAQR